MGLSQDLAKEMFVDCSSLRIDSRQMNRVYSRLALNEIASIGSVLL